MRRKSIIFSLSKLHHCAVGDARLVSTLTRFEQVVVPVGVDHAYITHARYLGNNIYLLVAMIATPLIVTIDPAVALTGDDDVAGLSQPFHSPFARTPMHDDSSIALPSDWTPACAIWFERYSFTH